MNFRITHYMYDRCLRVKLKPIFLPSRNYWLALSIDVSNSIQGRKVLSMHSDMDPFFLWRASMIVEILFVIVGLHGCFAMQASNYIRRWVKKGVWTALLLCRFLIESIELCGTYLLRYCDQDPCEPTPQFIAFRFLQCVISEITQASALERPTQRHRRNQRRRRGYCDQLRELWSEPGTNKELQG